MTPEKTAAINLTDYIAVVASRIIVPMQASPSLPAGTRQWRAEVWDADLSLIEKGEWTKSRSDAFAEASELMQNLEVRLIEQAEAEMALERSDQPLVDLQAERSRCWGQW